MAIVITLPDSFSIENYTGLQAFLNEHLELPDDVVAQLPNLIRMAEYRLARLLLTPERETSTTLSATASTQAVTLPATFRQMKQLRILGDESGGYPLDQVSLNVVETYDWFGKPTSYAISGSTVLLGPIPDAAYSLGLRYMTRLPPLTDNSQTNWLLQENADAYIYMAAAVVQLHLKDAEGATLYNTLAEGVVNEINQQGVRQRVSVPIRLRSPGCVV